MPGFFRDYEPRRTNIASANLKMVIVFYTTTKQLAKFSAREFSLSRGDRRALRHAASGQCLISLSFLPRYLLFTRDFFDAARQQHNLVFQQNYGFPRFILSLPRYGS